MNYSKTYKDYVDTFAELYKNRGFAELQAIKNAITERYDNLESYIDSNIKRIEDTLKESANLTIIDFDKFNQAEKLTIGFIERLRGNKPPSVTKDELLSFTTNKKWVDNQYAEMYQIYAEDIIEIHKTMFDLKHHQLPAVQAVMEGIMRNNYKPLAEKEIEETKSKRPTPPENDLRKELIEIGEDYELTRKMVVDKAAELVVTHGDGNISKFRAKSDKQPANAKLYKPVFEHFQETGAHIPKSTIRKYCGKAIKSKEFRKKVAKLKKKRTK